MGVLPSQFNRKEGHNIRRSGARRAGTTFPDGPVEGDTFWKTDSLDYWIWDGTSWREITII